MTQNKSLLEDLRSKLEEFEDATARLKDAIATIEALEEYDSMFAALKRTNNIEQNDINVENKAVIDSLVNNFMHLSLLQRVLFVIKKLKVAKVNDVYEELIRLDPTINKHELKKRIRDYGRIWYEKGEILKVIIDGEVVYRIK